MSEGGQQGREWLVASQQQHKSKLHRKVDRKASKGRKTVRYYVRPSVLIFELPLQCQLFSKIALNMTKRYLIMQRYTVMQELVNFMAPVSVGEDAGGNDDDDEDDRVDVSRLLVGNLFRSINA